MPHFPTYEAKVKDSYRAGAVYAFSGYEYVRTEYRPVPHGFEDAALVHLLLDVREAKTKQDVKVAAKDHLADTLGTADRQVAEIPTGGAPATPPIEAEPLVTTITEPAEEEPTVTTVTDSEPEEEELPARPDAPQGKTSRRRSKKE